ncbi:LiaF-related protein [Halogeometricum sp. S1BR25-6]|uniref:LiaF-related protein n=1 Tax=Halogeometricum salsisoli TaxID=2950536 RepID=A0ABU2GJN9_9EURY|nr:LiaF domain-containing protein [Halogeometricum sp. S1BR25-6]MDS0301037.1 LiaF-related protein [Halogeometricum sp. S1BR25-6]
MSDTQSITTSRPPRTRRLLGGLVVVLGLILLADTTGVVAVDGFEVFLAGALVVYGGYRLVSERARHLLWPGTFLLVGTGWLLVEFGVLTGAQARQFWPLLVVLFGISLLRRRRHPGILSSDISITENGMTDESGITAVFEDARLDLRGVDVPTPSTVEAVAIFGDTEIVVPGDWVVVVESTSIFGTIRDLRRSHPTGEPDLIINGTAIFGDVRLMD